MNFSHTNGVYSQMVTEIYRSIATGELPIGTRIPTESQLRDKHKISINSVRRGVSLLVKEGIIAKRQGSGMYVSRIPAASMTATRPDSIGVYFETKILTFHPYYSEMRRGIADALDQKKWKLLPLSPYDAAPDPWEVNNDITFPGHREQGIANLASHREMAGVILRCQDPQGFLAGSGRSIPVAIPGFHESLPFAGYDWKEEIFTALRILVRRGARNILSVGEPASPAEMDSLLRRAAASEDRSQQVPGLIVHEVSPSSIYSVVVRAGYEATHRYLRDRPEIDAILAGSDFATQGALDALAEHGSTNGRRIPVVALINRASQFHTAIPFTAVVADGYRVGVNAVELLHERITAPSSAPHRILLRGDVREID